jgi:hypothetical protein
LVTKRERERVRERDGNERRESGNERREREMIRS